MGRTLSSTSIKRDYYRGSQDSLAIRGNYWLLFYFVFDINQTVTRSGASFALHLFVGIIYVLVQFIGSGC